MVCAGFRSHVFMICVEFFILRILGNFDHQFFYCILFMLGVGDGCTYSETCAAGWILPATMAASPGNEPGIPGPGAAPTLAQLV